MRRLTTVPVLAAAAVLAGVGSADAAGLPQLDPENFAPQLVWLAISFTLLYWLMTRLALPRISTVLEEREHKIGENLKKAEAIKAEAEAKAKAYADSLADARTRAQAIVREAAERYAAEATERHAALGRALAEDVETAEARIAAARDEALAGLRGMASEVAVLATERLIGTKPDRAAADAAVAAILESRP